MNKSEEKPEGRTGLRILFILYLFLVIKLLIFKYPIAELREIANTWESHIVWEGLDSANFTLFKTIKMYINYAYKLNSFENLVGNVVVFFPFGFFLPRISRWANNWFMTLGAAFFFSLGIELFQLFSAFGAFDVDDLLLNVLGTLVGYWIHLLVRCIYDNA